MHSVASLHLTTACLPADAKRHPTQRMHELAAKPERWKLIAEAPLRLSHVGLERAELQR